MIFVKKILARFWAVWGLISFVATFLIFVWPALLSYFKKDPQGQAFFIRISKLWMNIWLPLIGCPLRISGQAHFEPGKTYVVVFNHNALLDIPISCPYVPGANKTIAKASFTKVPLFGLFYRKGSVIVDRSDPKSRSKSFEEMIQVLQSGMHMCIYPEGTRNRTNQLLKPFYDGAFRLAARTQHAIIPCIIRGTREAMPITETFYLWPHPLHMEFLPPVSTENKSVEELKNEVFAQMLARLKDYNS
jgi:1-acyl-sn-glycerol-3-phosphate acyltransferase